MDIVIIKPGLLLATFILPVPSFYILIRTLSLIDYGALVSLTLKVFVYKEMMKAETLHSSLLL